MVGVSYELRHLRCFVAVADELHFGRAAASLHLGQPTVSRAVADLERLLGVSLVSRSTRHVTLTADGTALLAQARDTLAASDRLMSSAADLARGGGGGGGGTFVVVLHDEGAAELTAPILGAFSLAHPDVQIVVRQLGYDELATCLESGAADAVLSVGEASANREAQTLFLDGRGVVVGPGHELYDAPEARVTDVIGERYFGLQSPSQEYFGRYWMADHRNGDTSYEHAGDATDMTGMLYGILLGRGITGASASTERYTALGELRYVPLVDAGPMPVTATIPARSPTSLQQRFLAIARTTASELAKRLVPTSVPAG